MTRKSWAVGICNTKTVDSVRRAADWLAKLRISCAIYLRATREKNGVLVCIIIFCGVYYLTVLEYTKTTIHLCVGG